MLLVPKKSVLQGKVLYYLGKNFSSGVFYRFGLIWDFRVGVLRVIHPLTDPELGASKSSDYLKPMGLLLLVRRVYLMFQKATNQSHKPFVHRTK